MKQSTDDSSDLRQHSIQGIPVGEQKIQIGSIDQFLQEHLKDHEPPIAVTIKYDLQGKELVNVFVRRPARYTSPMGPAIELWYSFFRSQKEKRKKKQQPATDHALMQPLLGEEEATAQDQEANLQIEGFDQRVQEANESGNGYIAVEATLWCKIPEFAVKYTMPPPTGSPMGPTVIAFKKWVRKVFDLPEPAPEDPFEDAPERDYV